MISDDNSYYEQMLSMFATDAWKDYSEQLEMSLKQLKDSAFVDCTDNNLWQYRRGQVETFERILSFENSTRIRPDDFI